MESFNKFLQDQDYSVYMEFMQEHAEVKHLKRNEYFGYQNTPAQYMGYVREGGVRYTCIDKTGKEHIVGYSFTGEFVSDYPSFIHKTPRMVNMQAVQNTVLYTVTRAQFMNFVQQNEQMKEIYIKTTEAYIETMYRRLLSFYCDTPDDRYLNLLEQYPNIQKVIPLKEIASFIGVTPETLSHIRKRLREDGQSLP